MSQNTSSSTIQHQFATWVRGTEQTDLAVHSPQRVAVYQTLVSTIFNNALSRAFPIAKKILCNDWESLVVEFMQSGATRNPELWMMPQDFVQFAQDQALAKRLRLPFLDDLLTFEWTEIYIYMMQDIHESTQIRSDNLETKDSALLINRESTILKLHYPVFRPFTPTQILEDLGEYFLLVYRHPQKLNVNFIQLSPLLVVLVELLKQDLSPKSAISTLADSFPHLTLPNIEKAVDTFLRAMLAQGMIIN